MPVEICKRCGQANSPLENELCPQCQTGLADTIAPSSDSETASSITDDAIDTFPDSFGEYDLLKEVARGGMGVIYKARHRKLNRISALKMILSGRFSSSDQMQRFHIEAEAAAQLDHPGIVPVYEIGEIDGHAFFAMKYIEGGSLADQINRFHQNPRAAVELLVKVVRAVHHAHQRGILHRDLKPANILLDENDEPLITDLGLAKSTANDSNLTNTGAIMGTPSYMPPEQASGDGTITTAADIYSLGAILYELLTGKPPYRGASAIDTMMKVLDGPPPAPHTIDSKVNRDLEAICMKCLQHDPSSRYDSALKMADDLDAWLAGRPISVKPPSFTARITRWFQKNRRPICVSLGVLAGILVTLPFALTFVAEGAGFASVYAHFPDDQTPWVFTIGEDVPGWTRTGAALFLIFVLWPSIGLLNALLANPKNMLQAVGAGLIGSLLLMTVFFVTLGWMPLSRMVVTSDQPKLEDLANAVWPPDGVASEEALLRANQLYAGLEEIPDNERANVFTRRYIGDQLAVAPVAYAAMALLSLLPSIPIIYGTVIGHVLIRRGNRFLVCVMRYAVAWVSIFVAIVFSFGLIATGIKYNGRPFHESLLEVGSVIGISLLLCFLSLRRWRRKK